MIDELRALYLAEVALSSEERVEINVEVRDLWLVVNALQLSTIHPGLHEPLRGWMVDIGRRIQEVITTVMPETEELLEAGWHRENDVDYDDGGVYRDEDDEEFDDDPDWIPF